MITLEWTQREDDQTWFAEPVNALYSYFIYPPNIPGTDNYIATEETTDKYQLVYIKSDGNFEETDSTKHDSLILAQEQASKHFQAN